MKAKEWDRIAENCPTSSIYHLSAWGTLLEEVHRYPLIYLQEDDGIFPLALVKSRFFGNRLISLPFADYGGPCFQNEDAATRLVASCQDMARQQNVALVEVRCPDPRYAEALERQGFIKRCDYLTFVLPLDKSRDELWRGIGDKNRNMVRKASRSGVEIATAENEKDVAAFYSLYQRTMKKLGSPPQPERFFRRMWDLFYPDHLTLPLATYKGSCIAAGIFLLHNNVIHHAYSCSLKQHLNLAPNDLIQWSMIEWGNERGFRSLDFGRTREGEGTVLFKRRWGGDAIKMPYYYKFYGKELKERQEIRYRRLSDLWARCMPGFLANRIGPWLIKQIG